MYSRSITNCDVNRNEERETHFLNDRLDIIFHDLSRMVKAPIKDQHQCQVINELWERLVKYKRTGR